MQIRTKSLIVAAALAALPAAANAVTITYTIDPTLMYSPTRTGTFTQVPAADITTSGTTTTVTLPAADAGYYFQFGVDGQLSNTTGGSAALLPSPQVVTGLGGFAFGLSDSNAATAQVFGTKSSNAAGTAITTPVIAPSFAFNAYQGSLDGNGGVQQLFGTSGNVDASSQTHLRSDYHLGIGSSTPLATGIEIGSTSTGTSTFTLLPYNAGTSYVAFTGGTAPGTSSSKYQQDGFTALDTAAAAPSLKLVIGGVSTSHSIISLTSGTTVGSSYGPGDGVIAVAGQGNGSYTPTPATGFLTAATGSVAVSGFSPTSDTEVYALKLNNASGVIAPGSSILSAIVSDINGGNGNVASAGVTASLVTGVYTSLFPGYDILLTSTGFTAGTLGTAELGFDFSSAGEVNSADSGITVTGVAAVPEPATAAGIVLGAAGLLLGRRRKLAAVA